MHENILETLRGLLFYNFPKNLDGFPVVYDQPVSNWYSGPADLTGVVPPAVVIRSAESNNKDVTYGGKEIEHSISIEFWAQGDDRESSARNASEGSRILYEILLPFKRMWVAINCPICEKVTLSPLHFTAAHALVLDPFISSIYSDFATRWNLTHTPPITDTGISNSAEALLTANSANGVAAEAYRRLWEAVRVASTNTIVNLPNNAYSNIKAAQRDLLYPIRILTDINVTSAKTITDEEAEEFLYKGSMTFTAKELRMIAASGPDGPSVPTEAL